MEGQGYSLVATRGNFHKFLEDFQQLLEEFPQLAQALGVGCLEEGFVAQSPSESIADKGNDG